MRFIEALRRVRSVGHYGGMRSGGAVLATGLISMVTTPVSFFMSGVMSVVIISGQLSVQVNLPATVRDVCTICYRHFRVAAIFGLSSSGLFRSESSA